MSTHSEKQNAAVRESDDKWLFALLDLGFHLHLIVRPWTLVVAGEHDKHKEERRQELDGKRLALGHVTSGDSTSGRCPCDDVTVIRWRRRDVSKHESDCGSTDGSEELSSQVEDAASEADTACREHSKCNGRVDMRVADCTRDVNSCRVCQTERQGYLQQSHTH